MKLQWWYTIVKSFDMDYEYIRCGDYTIPDLKLPEETRSIGKWGRMHRDYLREHHPIQ